MNNCKQNVLLGITGGIAAYKIPILVRRMREQNIEVRVVMTRAAAEFITPLTLAAVSGQPVHTDLLDMQAESAMGHIELARWPDRILIAPASADFICRLSIGMADDLLSTLCLATDVPISIVPAMNQVMWENAATQDNIERLRQRGIDILGPAVGDQACGESGPGRMLEPEEILQLLTADNTGKLLSGLRVVLTAGPTQEALDPVRILTNHSSGKMGYAVARAAQQAGASVHLITGPTNLAIPPGIDSTAVISAADMHKATLAAVSGADIFIAVAAVSDYRPVKTSARKLKKSTAEMTLTLARNPDILADVAAIENGPYCVGFAAETEKLEQHARQKLKAKNIDLIAANRVGKDLAFDSKKNALILIDRQGRTDLPNQDKQRLAEQLVSHIATKYRAKNQTENS